MDSAPEILPLILGWLIVAGVSGALACAVWVWVPDARGPLLPPQRRRATPWGFHQIIIVVFACLCWELLLIRAFMTGARTAETAASLVADAVGAAAVMDPVHYAAAVRTAIPEYLDAKADELIRSIWAGVLAMPLQLATIVFALRHFADARPYQLGLTVHRWAKNVQAGFWLWLGLTPLVYLIFLGVVQFLKPTSHPLEVLARIQADGQVWTLMVLSALVARPVVEEVAFRGMLQPWMARSPVTADLTVMLVLAGVVLGVVSGGSQTDGYEYLWRGLLLVSVGAGYLLFERLTWRWMPQVGAARAIYASSLLFAAIHANIWPSPIPLFFLSLGLGFLAYRTQSLVGSITVHVLFNAVSVAAMFIT